MLSFFHNGGIIQWLLLLVAVFIIVQVVSILILIRKKDFDKIQKRSNSILSWSVFSLLISFAYLFLSFYRSGTELNNAPIFPPK